MYDNSRGRHRTCITTRVVGIAHVTKTGSTLAPITRIGTLLVSEVVVSAYVGDRYALRCVTLP